jgi:hypothetical protein
MTGTQKTGIPVRILDILETDGMWMTAEALEAEICDRFGPVKLESIRRAIYRLVNDQLLEHRLVEFIDYQATQKDATRGAQATPSGWRMRHIMEVRTV